jgi:hypothetical protein
VSALVAFDPAAFGLELGANVSEAARVAIEGDSRVEVMDQMIVLHAWLPNPATISANRMATRLARPSSAAGITVLLPSVRLTSPKKKL